MNTDFRKILSSKVSRIIAGLLIFITMVIFGISYFIRTGYVRQLPDDPAESLTQPLIEQISDARDKASGKPTAKNIGYLGMVYHSAAYYEKAAECYKLAIKRKRRDWKWHYYLGYLFLEMGQPEEAIKSFKEVIALNPDAYHAWYYIGEEYHNLGDAGMAEMALNKSAINTISPAPPAMRTDYFPLSVYAHFQLARVKMENKNFEASGKILQSIINEFPSYGPAYRLLGNVYNMEGNTALSQRYINRANDLAIYTPPVDTLIDRLSLLSRSELYLLKKIDEAENGVYPEWAMKLMINGYKYLPENKYLISKFIKLYLMMNFGNQASPLLEKHRQLFHDDFSEISTVANLLYDKGLYDQALEHYRLAAQIKPDEAGTYKDIILCIWQTGNKSAAMDSTLKWLNKNPADHKVLSEGIGLLLNMKEREKAKIYYNKLKGIAAMNADLMNISGKIARADGDTIAAKNWFEKAFRLKPKDFSTVEALLNLMLDQSDWKNSIRFMKEALIYHPGEPLLLERLGTLLITCPDEALRNVSEGKEYSERAFYNKNSKSITLAAAGRSLAIANALLGDKENARSILQTTINIAKREGISASYVADMERLLTALKQ